MFPGITFQGQKLTFDIYTPTLHAGNTLQPSWRLQGGKITYMSPSLLNTARMVELLDSYSASGSTSFPLHHHRRHDSDASNDTLHLELSQLRYQAMSLEQENTRLKEEALMSPLLQGGGTEGEEGSKMKSSLIRAQRDVVSCLSSVKSIVSQPMLPGWRAVS